ncbi:hypothetical protein [Eubacterium ventriosum]|uniref:hypothetical protein n=1 Tax=Eubacterium ventriosum TaxID=39496 RepID=UPI003520F0C2
MKKILKQFKKKNYKYVYEYLAMNKYEYTIDNFEKDFAMISSLNKFIYLIYLISNENTFRNVILICDFLEYTDTFFFDIYSVIGFFIRQYLNSNPKDLKMKEWVISRYSENPDSPFTQDEIMSWRHDTQ